MKFSTLVVVAAVALTTAEARADKAIRLAPGGSRAIELPENPSTGYTWRIDRDASEGLDRVAIRDDGHKRGANMPGAPGTHRWTIRAVKPGRATIRFDYQRPWEPAPVDTRSVAIDVSRRQSEPRNL